MLVLSGRWEELIETEQIRCSPLSTAVAAEPGASSLVLLQRERRVGVGGEKAEKARNSRFGVSRVMRRRYAHGVYNEAVFLQNVQRCLLCRVLLGLVQPNRSPCAGLARWPCTPACCLRCPPHPHWAPRWLASALCTRCTIMRGGCSHRTPEATHGGGGGKGG